MNHMERKHAQMTAMKHVCLLAEEPAHPRYAWIRRHRSVVVTINAGFE